MHQKILILDFGSQFTQLIARRLRELNVYCEIHPYNKIPQLDENMKGIILSGSPASVHDKAAPQVDIDALSANLPVMGVCYGAQLIANNNGGVVSKTSNKEYGRAILNANTSCELFAGIAHTSQVWMSHGDTITSLPAQFEIVATTDSIPVAGFRVKGKNIYGIQFHPEVTHSIEGKTILKNFVYNICGCKGDWTPANFVQETVEQIKQTVGDDKVILGLSGGVDSSVAAVLISKAIGKRLHCIFINHGLLRKNEFEEVLQTYKSLDLNVKGVDASEVFYNQLNGVSDPEQKRKIIGRVFVEMFDKEATQVEGARWLAQGTIYPDVIESVSVNGPSATIKSHHNVGGLPEKMNLKVLEPLRNLFKDEVRNVGTELGLPKEINGRHPFPGPGLAIRILGAITQEKVKTLQEADSIYINELKAAGWYDKIWQAGAIFLPVQSVGVMGDERTYENAVCLRAVTSTDGMTADWVHIPYELLAAISNKIINNVKGINRVVYDISSKPPATIEWE
ncbi:MAG: glutamine-hydrolyzing GMP synthase [Bacteroidia bacterium]|nr:glutamine-hydrolyzing GMP synthase [Bacteroidia bacterium]MCO5252899.1 glutamine-hydrolyzing GMP synthase [Bacteroidota bacterium]